MARGKRTWTRRRFLHDASLTGAVLAQRGSLPALHAEIPAESIASEHVLFFEQPAATWPDALPVGNGRLGAMVFGNPANERLQLNEETIWIGERRDRNNPQASRTPEVRKLLMVGMVHEAEALAAQVMMGVPDRLPCYQTLGDLWLDFDNVPAAVTNYRLELDLDEAVVTTRFTVAGARWTREVFSSAPRNVIVARIESTHPFALTLRLDRPLYGETTAATNDRLVMTGAARPVKPTKDPATQERQVGVAFRAELKAIPEDGTARAEGNTLRIENARAVTLLLTASTDFRAHVAARAISALSAPCGPPPPYWPRSPCHWPRSPCWASRPPLQHLAGYAATEMAAPSPLRGTVPHRSARVTTSSVALTAFSHAHQPVRAALDHFGRATYPFSGTDYHFGGADYLFDGVEYPFDGFYHPRLATKSPRSSMVRLAAPGSIAAFGDATFLGAPGGHTPRHRRDHAGRLRARVLGLGFRRWRVFLWRRTFFRLPGD